MSTKSTGPYPSFDENQTRELEEFFKNYSLIPTLSHDEINKENVFKQRIDHRKFLPSTNPREILSSLKSHIGVFYLPNQEIKIINEELSKPVALIEFQKLLKSKGKTSMCYEDILSSFLLREIDVETLEHCFIYSQAENDPMETLSRLSLAFTLVNTIVSEMFPGIRINYLYNQKENK